MTIVYGESIEPGGMALDNECSIIDCPNCGKEAAQYRYWEACEGGSINTYHSIYCPECGHREGDMDDDDYIDWETSPFDSYPFELSFCETVFGDALSVAIDARCEIALARILATTNEAAAAEHLEVARSLAHREGHYAYRNGRDISPLMSADPFLLKHWEEGVLDAKTDSAIARAGLG